MQVLVPVGAPDVSIPGRLTEGRILLVNPGQASGSACRAWLQARLVQEVQWDRTAWIQSCPHLFHLQRFRRMFGKV